MRREQFEAIVLALGMLVAVVVVAGVAGWGLAEFLDWVSR